VTKPKIDHTNGVISKYFGNKLLAIIKKPKVKNVDRQGNPSAIFLANEP